MRGHVDAVVQRKRTSNLNQQRNTRRCSGDSRVAETEPGTSAGGDWQVFETGVSE